MNKLTEDFSAERNSINYQFAVYLFAYIFRTAQCLLFVKYRDDPSHEFIIFTLFVECILSNGLPAAFVLY